MKKAASLTTFIIISVLAFISFPQTAAADTGTVAVTVRGWGKSGVKIEISSDWLTTPVEGTTGRRGTVSIAGLAPGNYILTPRKNGAVFTPEVAAISITSGATARVTISSSQMKAKVGMRYCVGCHDNFLSESYTDWLRGPHGNFQFVDAAHNEYDYDGFINYPQDWVVFSGFPTSASVTTSCLSCHGPWVNDNRDVAQFPLVKADGSVDQVNMSQIMRPVVGCETCHGSGRRHIANPFGRALTWDEPTAVQCGQCHNKDFPTNHLTYHPGGAGGGANAGIYEVYQASPHAGSVNSHVYTSGTTNVRARCSKCHTDQGARLFVNVDGTRDQIVAQMSGQADLANVDAVQCRTCHNSHNPNELLESATAATSTATARSAEFNTCTNCHQLLDASDQLMTSPYHNTHTESIRTKHYDNPTTDAIEGYNINRGSDTACADCHNPHVARLEINEEWAESGHGDLEGLGWEEQDFKSGSFACRRCHTNTGFKTFLNDPVISRWTASSASPDYSHLTGKQKELLYCSGCHTNDAFERRSLPIVNFPSGANVTLGDDSNLCMACHGGRESTVSVNSKIGSNEAGPYTFSNIHYLAAGVSLFGTEVKGGYEYTGNTYVSRNTFSGHGGYLDTCVKCHMRTDSSHGLDHRFLPEVSDCSSCHTGITEFSQIRPANTPDYDGDGNTTEGLKGELENFQTRDLAAIQNYAKNTLHFAICYNAAVNSYWKLDTNGNGVCDAGETTNYNKFNGKLLRAAYNYNFSIKEPDTFIHNHRYILQLLYDGIQDLGASTAGLTRPQ